MAIVLMKDSKRRSCDFGPMTWGRPYPTANSLYSRGCTVFRIILDTRDRLYRVGSRLWFSALVKGPTRLGRIAGT